MTNYSKRRRSNDVAETKYMAETEFVHNIIDCNDIALIRNENADNCQISTNENGKIFHNE
jgi:hypothetical protein